MNKKTFTPLLIAIVMLLAVACSSPEPVAPAVQESTEVETAVESTDAEEVMEEEVVEEEAMADDEATDSEEAVADDEAVDSEEAMADDEAMMEEGVAAGAFAINQEQSTVSFELDEDLRGELVTVVGTSNIVSGSVTFDINDLSTAAVGEIIIDAASLETDANGRNRAIRTFILDVNQFPNIVFNPTALNGLPSSAAVGETVNFEIVGDLTIRDVTLPVTFNTAVTVTSETEISGTATSNILYADFGLFIPDVPFVANVEDELELSLNFVANAQ